jgi:hypothetical protein
MVFPTKVVGKVEENDIGHIVHLCSSLFITKTSNLQMQAKRFDKAVTKAKELGVHIIILYL